jgi:hypothetical protein
MPQMAVLPIRRFCVRGTEAFVEIRGGSAQGRKVMDQNPTSGQRRRGTSANSVFLSKVLN